MEGGRKEVEGRERKGKLWGARQREGRKSKEGRGMGIDRVILYVPVMVEVTCTYNKVLV